MIYIAPERKGQFENPWKFHNGYFESRKIHLSVTMDIRKSILIRVRMQSMKTSSFYNGNHLYRKVVKILEVLIFIVKCRKCPASLNRNV